MEIELTIRRQMFPHEIFLLIAEHPAARQKMRQTSKAFCALSVPIAIIDVEYNYEDDPPYSYCDIILKLTTPTTSMEFPLAERSKYDICCPRLIELTIGDHGGFSFVHQFGKLIYACCYHDAHSCNTFSDPDGLIMDALVVVVNNAENIRAHTTMRFVI